MRVFKFGGASVKDADGIKAKLLTLNDADKAVELNTLAARVIQPYTIIAIILTVLAILLFFVKMPEVHEEETNVFARDGRRGAAARRPHARCGL